MTPDRSTGTYFMPQIIGSGAALFDFDSDGRLDIYLLNNGGPVGATNRLYQQTPDGTFEDVSQAPAWTSPATTWAWPSATSTTTAGPMCCVTQYGGDQAVPQQRRRHVHGHHRPKPACTIPPGAPRPPSSTTTATAGSISSSSTTSITIPPCRAPPRVASAITASRTFAGPGRRLFHNLGARQAAGRSAFEDVTVASGLGRLPGPGLGVLCADFDGDGWPDIFVANDGQPNRLWINQHDGTFKEEAVPRGVAYNGMGQAEAGMGIALGDVDGDGLFDLFVTHLTQETNTLWKQGPRGMFLTERGRRAGGLAMAWDGLRHGAWPISTRTVGLDLAVVNGRHRPARGSPARCGLLGALRPTKPAFLANDGTGKFVDRSLQEPAFCATPAAWPGLAVGDVDNDGALDLFGHLPGGLAGLFRNVAPPRGIGSGSKPSTRFTGAGPPTTPRSACRRGNAIGSAGSIPARAIFAATTPAPLRPWRGR